MPFDHLYFISVFVRGDDLIPCKKASDVKKGKFLKFKQHCEFIFMVHASPQAYLMIECGEVKELPLSTSQRKEGSFENNYSSGVVGVHISHPQAFPSIEQGRHVGRLQAV